MISVTDREPDFFDPCRERHGRVEIMVRAKHDRKLDSQGTKLSATMWEVHLAEIDPPEDEKTLHWYLLTSMEVGSAEVPRRMVER